MIKSSPAPFKGKNQIYWVEYSDYTNVRALWLMRSNKTRDPVYYSESEITLTENRSGRKTLEILEISRQ